MDGLTTPPHKIEKLAPQTMPRVADVGCLWKKCFWQGCQNQAYRDVFTALSGTITRQSTDEAIELSSYEWGYK